MNNEEILTQKCNKLINKLIYKSRLFCDRFCVPDGLSDILLVYSATGSIPDKEKYNIKLAYDYDYFAFTKSTKSLIAIKQLLKDKSYNFNEDCLILIRSIFENHIMSRYVREHVDNKNKRKSIINDFIINPLALSFNFFSFQGKNGIIDDSGNKVGDMLGPSANKMGKEKNYYKYLYPFLCQYTHCSFGALSCYFDNKLFTYTKRNFSLLILLLTVFVFTKIYEGVVTVDGEDLGSKAEERAYYDLI